ncbi:SRPBCC family protein [Flammeovirga sp. SJP92]|uniref:SRPBCC family protein n=1 Tax=Flammeovirga sp. SJP92 TaxID=1775430 RepID=UPI0015611CCF|nr:SRPBCC family protein [Flammeovirga sp. SJP92]
MIRYFSLGVLSVLLLFAGGAMLLPSEYNVKEHVYINAPRSAVFPYIENLRKWNDWAFKLEEEGSRLSPEYHGPDEGAGAMHTWMSYDGSSAELRVLESEPYDKVHLQMSTNEGTFISEMIFTLEKSGEGTLVTWNEKGDFGFQLVTRVIAFVADYETKVGEQYKAALEELKKASESNS